MPYAMPPQSPPAVVALAPEEQYLLELINRDRARAGCQPLVAESRLGVAATRHSRWMVQSGQFSHTGQGASQPTERMRQAGFKFVSPWQSGENIAYVSQVNDDAGGDVRMLHQELMQSPGHRANLLEAKFNQVGLGFQTGQGRGERPGYVTEDFAAVPSGPFLTGVAYADRNGDRFYSPGEGLGGVTVTVRSASGQTWSAVTARAGGYQIQLPPGAYKVSFSGPGVNDERSVQLGARNLKVDAVGGGRGRLIRAAYTPDRGGF